MKLLHIASFYGNIGDNISHLGLLNIFKRLGFEPSLITRLEMRRFYDNYKGADKLRFDEGLIKLMNEFDYCIIGGGGFLSYDRANSASACTLSFEPSLIKKIKVPTLFSSLGARGINDNFVPSKEIKTKFKTFLNALFENKNIFLSLRNDGSSEKITKDLGQDFAKPFKKVLDNGFFYELKKSALNLPVPQNFIAINITKDQILNANDKAIKRYYTELARLVEKIIDEFDLNFVFIPHIYSDLEAFYTLFNLINERHRRNYISVAACIQGDRAANFLANLYLNSRLSLCSRFHSNIINFALKHKSLGFESVERTRALFKSLNLENDCLNIYDEDFSQKSFEKIKQKLSTKKEQSLSLDALKNESLESFKHFIAGGGGLNIFNSPLKVA